MDLQIRDVALYPGVHAPVVIPSGHLVVRDGRIVALGPGDPPPPNGPAHVLLCEGFLAVPGLINGHTHSSEVLRRATTDCLTLDPWLAEVWPALDGMPPEASAAAARLAAVEMLKSGTTAAVDHWRRFPVALENLEATAAAYQEVGLRAAIAVMVRDRPHVPGGPPPSQDCEEQLAICEAAAGRWHRPSAGLSIMLGPSAAHRCSDTMLTMISKLADRLDLSVHAHLAEIRDHVRLSHALDGQGLVDRLEGNGLLSPRCSLAHAVWVDSADIERLARAGVTVIHNPVSNLKLGSGYAPVARMRARGVRVAMGTDGPASNDALNMFDAVKLAALLSRLGEEDTEKWLSATAVMEMTLHGGAAALGMHEALGRLAVGAPADIVLLKLDSPAMVPLGDPALHLTFCNPAAAVDTVIVNGKVVVRQGRMETADETAVYREARAWAERLRTIARA